MSTQSFCDRCEVGAGIPPLTSGWSRLSVPEELVAELDLCVACSDELRSLIAAADADRVAITLYGDGVTSLDQRVDLDRGEFRSWLRAGQP